MYDLRKAHEQYQQNKLQPPATQRQATPPPVTPAPLQSYQQPQQQATPSAMPNQPRPMGITPNTGPTAATVSGIPASMQQSAPPRPVPQVTQAPSYSAPPKPAVQQPSYSPPQQAPYTPPAAQAQMSVGDRIAEAVRRHNMTETERLTQNFMDKWNQRPRHNPEEIAQRVAKERALYEEQMAYANMPPSARAFKSEMNQNPEWRQPIPQTASVPSYSSLSSLSAPTPEPKAMQKSEVPTSAFQFRADDPRLLNSNYINSLPAGPRNTIVQAQERDLDNRAYRGSAGGSFAGAPPAQMSVGDRIAEAVRRHNMTEPERLAQNYIDLHNKRRQEQPYQDTRTPEERGKFNTMFKDAVARLNMTEPERLAQNYIDLHNKRRQEQQYAIPQGSNFGGQPGEAQARFERAAQIRSGMPSIRDAMNFNAGGAMSRQKTTEELTRDLLTSDRRSDRQLGANLLLGREQNALNKDQFNIKGTLDRDRLNMEQQSRQNADDIARRLSTPQMKEAEARAKTAQMEAGDREYLNWVYGKYVHSDNPLERNLLAEEIAALTGKPLPQKQLTYEQSLSNPDDPTSPMVRKPIIVDPVTGESKYAAPKNSNDGNVLVGYYKNKPVYKDSAGNLLVEEG